MGICSQEGEMNVGLRCFSFLLFDSVYSMRLSTPFSVKLLWEHPYIHTERCAFWVILKSNKLTGDQPSAWAYQESRVVTIKTCLVGCFDLLLSTLDKAVILSSTHSPTVKKALFISFLCVLFSFQIKVLLPFYS